MPLITSRHNPIVRRFRVLAADSNTEPNAVLLEGVHLVRAGIASQTPLSVAVVAESQLLTAPEVHDAVVELEALGTRVMRASDAVFRALSPLKTPQGLSAIGRRAPATVEQICGVRMPLVVVLDHVQDPGNVGAILRAAEAGGATGAIVTGHSASPFGWKAVRGSMGAVLRMPIAVGISVNDALQSCRASGLRSVAAVPRASDSMDGFDFSGPLALLLGGEGTGLSASLVASCDARVSIPMATDVESLNVATAAGILVYAARRCRQ